MNIHVLNVPKALALDPCDKPYRYIVYLAHVSTSLALDRLPL